MPYVAGFSAGSTITTSDTTCLMQVSVPYVAGFSAGSRNRESFCLYCPGVSVPYVAGFSAGSQGSKHGCLHAWTVSVPYVAGFSAGSRERLRIRKKKAEFQCPMWRAFRLDHRTIYCLLFKAHCFSALCGGLFGWIIWLLTCLFAFIWFQCPMWRAFRLDLSALRVIEAARLVSVPYVAGFSAGSTLFHRGRRAQDRFQCPMWRAFRLDPQYSG